MKQDYIIGFKIGVTKFPKISYPWDWLKWTGLDSAGPMGWTVSLDRDMRDNRIRHLVHLRQLLINLLRFEYNKMHPLHSSRFSCSLISCISSEQETAV